MTLPLTGTISAAMINLELGRPANAPFSLGGGQERALAGKPTGAISFADFYGKTMREPWVGEYYDAGITTWTVYIKGYAPNPPMWFGEAISPVVNITTTYIDKDGWRYHRGNYKGEDPGWWSDRRSYWGIWRERL